jgi:glycosyltransferase involved in cell wall biosynthesis
MPVFNNGEWLAAAISSVQAQSFREFELIIIDDGSTDQTEAIIANAARDDARIRTARQDHLGVSAALNCGNALARSPVIARMDGDDIADPDRLRKQLAFLEAHPGLAAVGSWAHVIDAQGRRTGELKPEAEPSALQSLLPKTNPFVHSSMMLSADVVRAVGGYRAGLEGAEDYDLWLRISERAQLANLPEFLLSYRRHSTSASATAARRQLLSARLARLSAMERRASRSDFIDTLEVPVQLNALQRQDGLRATAELYELLGRAANGRFAARELRALGCADLDHAERKAAQHWLKDLLKRQKGWAIRGAALFWLLLLHPPRGLSLVWSALRGR